MFLIALPFLLVRRLSATARSNLSRVIWQVGIGGTLLALAWNVLNLLGWPQPISAGPVVATLVWLLFMASLMFLRLLLARVRASHPDS